MTYEVSEEGIIDSAGKGAAYIGVGGIEAFNTTLAAATWMLEQGISLFSKKEMEDGSWWVMIQRSTICEPIGSSGPIPATQRVRGDGANMAEALVDAFEKMGVGGLRWKLHALERRVILLAVLLGSPKPPKVKKPTCPHGVSGGRCKQCV